MWATNIRPPVKMFLFFVKVFVLSNTNIHLLTVVYTN